MSQEIVTVREKFQGIFREVFDMPDLQMTDAMTAEDVADWDSLSHVQLVMAIETTFSVKFTTAEVMSLKNVGEFWALLNKKLVKS